MKKDKSFIIRPKVTISLNPILEAYCRYVFSTPPEQKEIAITRNKDIGKLIHAHTLSAKYPIKGPSIQHPVSFILPVNPDSQIGVLSRFLYVDRWGLQQIQDGIEYEFRKWVERRYEIGYFKMYEQRRIIEAILRGLNVRNNAANFDAIKKIDYRNRRKVEEVTFESLLTVDI